MTKFAHLEQLDHAQQYVHRVRSEMLHFCGIRVASQYATEEQWQAVLDARHGDYQLEALFEKLDEARVARQAAYASYKAELAKTYQIG